MMPVIIVNGYNPKKDLARKKLINILLNDVKIKEFIDDRHYIINTGDGCIMSMADSGGNIIATIEGVKDKHINQALTIFEEYENGIQTERK